MAAAGAPALRGAPARCLAVLLAGLLAGLVAGAAAAQSGVDAVEAAPQWAREGVVAPLAGEPEIGAPCTGEGGVVEIAGVGRAVYDRFAYDGATGDARLSGGVCVEVPGADARLRVEELRLAGLRQDGAGPPPVLSAAGALLDVQGWRLRVEALEGPIDDLRLDAIVVVGPGLVGTAAWGRVAGDEQRLVGVSLATPGYLIEAREARLTGDALVLTEASGTSCTCGVQRYRLVGRTLTARLGDDTATLADPALRILGVEIPLGDALTLGGPDGSAFPNPLAVDGDDDLGTVAVLRLRPGGGTTWGVGLATAPHPFPVATVEVRRGGDVVAIRADVRGPDVTFERRHDLEGGAWAEAFGVATLQGDDGLLRSGARAGWSGTRPLGGGATATLDVRTGAEIAVEPRLDAPSPRGAPDPASPRLPFRARLSLAAPLGGGATAGLDVTGVAVAYPGAVPPPAGGAGQATASIAPSLRIEGGGARLTLAAERRWATGASPFAFDAPEPRARASLDASVRTGPWTVRARAAWRFAPEAAGAEDLRFEARHRLDLAGGWALTSSLAAELAGLAGGPAGEDWVEARVEATRGVDRALGLRVREGVDPLDLRRVEAYGAWPLELGPAAGGVTLVPYLAVDVAGAFRGEGVRLSGHGLRAYVPDCCGTLIVGYRSEDGEATFEAGLRLPPLGLATLPDAELPALPAPYEGPLYGDAP